ncbi:hypothetical protein FRB96_007429 [Tulasnella sp. 330]|nr:hypothetical protein FRB96_007429 [Tulasnella sp. 330]
MQLSTFISLAFSVVAASAQLGGGPNPLTCGPTAIGCATTMTALGSPYTIQASSCATLGYPTTYTTTTTMTSLSAFTTVLTATLTATITSTAVVAKVSNNGHCYCQWTSASNSNTATVACDYNCPTGSISYATPATSYCPPVSTTIPGVGAASTITSAATSTITSTK